MFFIRVKDSAGLELFGQFMVICGRKAQHINIKYLTDIQVSTELLLGAIWT